MSLIRRTTITVLLLSVVAACSSSGGGKPAPSPSSTPAANQLGALANIGIRQSYTAVYNLVATNPQGSATLTVGRTPTAYRVSVQRGTSVSVLIKNSFGTYSCQRQPKKPLTCYVVARRGKPVPALFDAGQKLWSDYLVELSRHALGYLVTPAGTTPATATLPAGTCFAVATPPNVSASPVATGTYCLTEAGIPTKAAFASGTFTLTKIVAAPKPADLVPLAKPTPIPGLK